MAMRDENTEGAVISQLLNFPDAWDRVSDKLFSDLFTDETCRKVFAAIKRLQDKEGSAELVSVMRLLGESVSYEDFTGLKDFHSHSVRGIDGNILLLQEAAMARKLHKASYQIAGLAQDEGQGHISNRIELAKACLDELEFESDEIEYKDAMTIAIEHQDVLDARLAGTAISFATGFLDMDNLLGGGLEPGKFMIIGARPSVGKSAIALNIALNMSSHHPTAFMSMEMSYSDVADRQFAILGGAKMHHLRQPKNGLDWNKVVEATELSSTRKFYVSDKGGMTINGVRNFARRMKRKHGLQVLVLDYIGLMKGTNPKLDKRFQIEEITQGLKMMAKELGIAVVALAQLNRDADAHAFDIPGLKNLADSASMERDADIIAFLHRPIVTNPDLGDAFKNFAVLRVAKNRQGTPGDVNFYYQGEVMGFSEWHGESPIKKAKAAAPQSKGMRL